MRHSAPLALLLVALAAPAGAACYADYKAKRDDPLRLHYGVVEIPDGACTPEAAADALRTRLSDGWKLLEVISVFADDGLQQRRASAGDYFLRY